MYQSMAMTGISGLRAIGKSQDQELSLEEVERAFFYTEWYGNCPFMSILDSSVAAQPFEGIELSPLWRYGAYLASEDMTIVLSSAQANVCRRQGLRMLTLAILDFLILSGLLTDFEKGTGLAYDTLTQYEVPLFVPLHEGAHYRAMWFMPATKKVYVFDFLQMSTAAFSSILRLCEGIGYEVCHVAQAKIQRDGWSCGLWCIWANLLAHTFLQTGQTGLEFSQWVAQYLTELYACSEGFYHAFVQQFFSQLTVQVQNNVGANYVDLKLNFGEHNHAAIVQKPVGCEVAGQKGDCSGRVETVPAEDLPRTYKEALVQTVSSPLDVVTKPAHSHHLEVNMVTSVGIPAARPSVYKKKVKKLDYLKVMFQEIVDNCEDLASLNYRIVYSLVRPKIDTKALSDKQLCNAWYRMFGTAIGKHGVRSVVSKNETSSLVSENPYAVLTEQAAGNVRTLESGRKAVVGGHVLEMKQMGNAAAIKSCLIVQNQEGGLPELQNQKSGYRRGAEGPRRGMTLENKAIAEHMNQLLLQAGFMKGDTEHNRLALDFLLTIEPFLDSIGPKSGSGDCKNITKLEQYLRRQPVNWHSTKSTDTLSNAANPLYCHDVENDERLTGEKLTAKQQRQVSLEIFNEASQHCPSLPDIFIQVRRFCDTGVGLKRWTALLDRQLTERLSMHQSLDLDTAVYVKDLKSEGVFKTVQEKTLKAKVEALKEVKASAPAAEMYRDAVWSDEHELDYLAACKRVRLNLSNGTLRTWAEAIMLNIKSSIPMRDVMRRLFKHRQDQCNAEDVGVEAFMEAAENLAEDDCSDEDEGDVFLAERLAVAEAAADFARVKKEGPIHRCGCCGQLCFKSSVKVYTAARHEKLHTMPEVQRTLEYLLALRQDDPRRNVCLTCNDALMKNRQPRFCFGETLPHNEIPETVQELSELEAALCSPHIAFSKIVNVQWQKQKRLIGAVINVPANYKTTVKTLPRTDIKDFRIAVDLTRKLEYRGNFRSGLVRPYEVRRACALLCKTPLYRAYDIEMQNTLDGYLDVQATGLADDATDTFENLSADKADDLDVVKDEQVEAEELPLIKDKADLGKAHTNKDGIEIVADDDELYEDDECIDEERPVTETFLDIETNANELRQSCMRVAPSEGNHPQGLLRSKHGEELAYPRLYGGFERQGYGDTPYYMIARHELRSADRRFATDVSKIFFSMRKMHCQNVCGIANMAVRRAHRGRVTAGQLLNPVDREDICHHDLGYFSLKTLRSSPAYKLEMKKDIFAMIKQLHKPCWFHTLTFGDGRWHELTRILFEVKHSRTISDEALRALTSVDRAKLISEDPVTCARYYQKRATLFLQKMLMGTSVLGKVVDFAGVDEFTAMGNPHTHLLLWVEDAPVFGRDSDADVVKFIDKFVTTDLDCVAPDLGNVQRHMHKKRCGGRHRKCSFGFPKPPLRETMILQPLELDELTKEEATTVAENQAAVLNALRSVNTAMKDAVKNGRACREANRSFPQFLSFLKLTEAQYYLALRSSIDRPTVFHKRKLQHLMVNPFNKTMLTSWDANMDLQYILNPWAATMYVASYISKAARGLTALMRDLQAGRYRNSADMIRRTGSAWINTSEISAQEATYHVLGLPLRRFSRSVQFVNTSPPDKQHYMALRKSDLQGLDADDTNCLQKSH